MAKDDIERMSGVKGQDIMIPADFDGEVSKRRGFLRRTLTRVTTAISRKEMKLKPSGMRTYNVDELSKGFERKSAQNSVDSYTKLIQNEAQQDPSKK